MHLKNIAIAVLLIVVGVLVVPAAQAIAAGDADTLCVTDAGGLHARSSCRTGERPFKVIDGRMHESRMRARTADDGRNSARSDVKYATGGEFQAEEAVETAARAFTKKWTVPAGWDGKIVDQCPADMVPIAGNAYFPGFGPSRVPDGLSKTLGMPTVLVESYGGGPNRDVTLFTTQMCAPRVELEAEQR